MTDLKLHLGKKPARKDNRDLLFRKYAIGLPSRPTRWGHGFTFSDWLMLANGPDDSYAPGFSGCGDCVIAGGEHETMVWNKIWESVIVNFDGKTAVADYSAITGYNPNDPTTDNGTDPRQAYSYRRSTGLIDSNGQHHMIYAYAALTTGDWNELLEATYLFGAAGIGFQFPNSAWDQFNNGQPWDVVTPDGGIDGGHYVPCVGFGNPAAGDCAVITWGKRQVMTKAFYEQYSDEAYAILSPETIKSGVGPHGFNLQQLEADLAQL
jgi:hypothetical protein